MGFIVIALDMLAETVNRTGEIRAYRALAVAYLRRGEQQRALQAAGTAANLIARSSPAGYFESGG